MTPVFRGLLLLIKEVFAAFDGGCAASAQLLA
jgi:hypothetical protein